MNFTAFYDDYSFYRLAPAPGTLALSLRTGGSQIPEQWLKVLQIIHFSLYPRKIGKKKIYYVRYRMPDGTRLAGRSTGQTSKLAGTVNELGVYHRTVGYWCQRFPEFRRIQLIRSTETQLPRLQHRVRKLCEAIDNSHMQVNSGLEPYGTLELKRKAEERF